MKNILSLCLIGLITFTSVAQTELTDANAESKLIINNNRLIVLDFYATWCGPCKRMDPILKELENTYGDSVDFYKIDVDKNKVDDALGVEAMPTYMFIKNGQNLEKLVGAQSKSKMENLIIKHMYSIGGSNINYYSADTNHGKSDEFSDDNINILWNDWRKLNSLAWHAYEKHEDVKSLVKAIKIVERSVEIQANYYNTDTHAALLYKTGNYTLALKKAKKAIEIAKRDGLTYTETSQLMDKIIEDM